MFIFILVEMFELVFSVSASSFRGNLTFYFNIDTEKFLPFLFFLVCFGAIVGANGGRVVFGCTGPLRPESCAGVEIVKRSERKLVWGGTGAVLWGGGEVGQPLRTTLHTISMSPKQFLRIAYLETRGAERYMFVAFLRMKNQIDRTKNRSSKKLLKKDRYD